jgi:septum site-determining protein MinC
MMQDAASELFATETMAELCARQGRTGDAVAIYRRLLGGAVDEERRSRWAARLAVLEQAAAARPPAADGDPAERPSRPGPRTPPPPPPPPAPRAEPVEVPVPPADRPPHRPPLLIEAQVRSGQIIYAQDRDLIVLAPVNPGAQLLADGHIHVYAPLRGRAVAGAHGWREARIFCARLEAELIGIDIAYLTSEDLPRDRLGKPVQVVLRDGRCVLAPL